MWLNGRSGCGRWRRACSSRTGGERVIELGLDIIRVGFGRVVVRSQDPRHHHHWLRQCNVVWGWRHCMGNIAHVVDVHHGQGGFQLNTFSHKHTDSWHQDRLGLLVSPGTWHEFESLRKIHGVVHIWHGPGVVERVGGQGSSRHGIIGIHCGRARASH